MASPHPSPRLQFVNPQPGDPHERVDQGVDYSSVAGRNVLAIAREKLVGIIPNWYQGQPLLNFQILDANGNPTGIYDYVAEGIRSLLRIGQTAQAGQPVAVETGGPTGIELGFSTASGQTLAQATTGYTEGQATPAGEKYLQEVVQGGGTSSFSQVRPGGEPAGAASSGQGTGQALQAYVKLRDMPRTAPPSGNPFSWWWSSFTGDWADMVSDTGPGVPTPAPTRALPNSPFTGGRGIGGFVATAYGPPWGGIEGGGTTATGVDLHNAPHDYIVAVDPSVIPLHTKLKINPNPFGNPNIVFRAEDTGGAIKGRRIDFYDWRGRASQDAWGVRDVQVTEGT